MEFTQAREASAQGRRLSIEDEWEEYRPLCPDSERAFLTMARAHFRGARWQMHCTVIASKLPGFTSGTKDGPDF